MILIKKNRDGFIFSSFISVVLILVALADADVVVLCYHRIIEKPKYIYDVSVGEFENQIKALLNNGYKIIKIDDLLAGINKKNLPEKAVIVTIDDGDISSYEFVYPVAKKYKIPITLFIYTDYIGRGKRSISWEKLEELSKSSLVDIGSHTRTHPHLTRLKIKNTKELDIKKIEKEIIGSKNIIEEKLKIKIRFFAYPYGLYNNVIENIVMRAGYEAAFILDWGNNNLDTNGFRIKRKIIVSTTDIKKFMSIIKMKK